MRSEITNLMSQSNRIIRILIFRIVACKIFYPPKTNMLLIHRESIIVNDIHAEILILFCYSNEMRIKFTGLHVNSFNWAFIVLLNLGLSIMNANLSNLAIIFLFFYRQTHEYYDHSRNKPKIFYCY